MKKIGIIGGLGAETGCMFYASVNNRIYAAHRTQPEIIMINIPVPSEAYDKLSNGEVYDDLYTHLEDATIKLNILGVDLIAIPCNTVHFLIGKLRLFSKAPILSVVEETAHECSKKSYTKAGVLASTTSVRKNLHKSELNKYGIETILPNEKDQSEITCIIKNILELRASIKDVNTINRIADSLAMRGADCILLGCTDLRTIVKIKEIGLPVVESTSSLENAVVEMALT